MNNGSDSPFLNALLSDVFYVKHSYYCYSKIEQLRAKLLMSKKTLSVLDLGASAKTNKPVSKRLSDVVRLSVKPAKGAQFLFRLVNRFQPPTVLELGTSLGLTTAYLAYGNRKAKLITIEGSEALANEAKKNLKALGLKNIKGLVGDFEKVLPEVIRSVDKLDFVFFDGNHQKTPTLEYFYKCIEKAHAGSVFVFDDIYWSKEMTVAWAEIKADPRVRISVDLFSMGVLFFIEEEPKQDFIIKL